MTLTAAFALAATALGAGAASLHRLAVTQTSGNGSLGSTTFDTLSTTGGALQAQTGTAPDTTLTLPYAFFGEYNANSSGTFGIGVAGVSTTGYGVAAEATAANPSIFGESLGGADGIDGIETGGTSSTSYAGVAGIANGSAQFGVFGHDNANSLSNIGDYGVGVVGESKNGIAMAAVNDSAPDGVSTDVSEAQFALSDGRGAAIAGTSGTQAVPALEATSVVRGGDILHANANYAPGTASTTLYIQGLSQNRSGTVSTAKAASDVQLQGDLYLTGRVYTACSDFPATSSSTCSAVTAAATLRTSGGQMVDAYVAHHASPTVEDEGEAQLVNGVAHVTLDPTFASSMSTRSPYLVFLTPQGDSALYVVRKGSDGFDVREVGGGRATLAFDYRIVAHPFGEPAARMAVVHRTTALHSDVVHDPFANRAAFLGRLHAVKPVRTVELRGKPATLR